MHTSLFSLNFIMGGKASKIIAETTLVKCNTHGDGSKFPVICATPTDEAIEGLKGGELPDTSVRPHGTGTRVHRVVTRNGKGGKLLEKGRQTLSSEVGFVPASLTLAHSTHSCFSDALDKENCYKLGGKNLVEFKVVTQLGLKLKHTRILDSDGKNRAFIISKAGLTKGETIILKKLPNYSGQEAVDPEMLHKNGIDRDLKLYNFAKIETKKTGLSSCVAKYSLVVGGSDGEDQYKLLYTAEKLGSMGFHCIVKTPGGDAVATAEQTSATCDTIVNVAEGVDLAAVLLTAKKTYHGDAATAGALAGAGVA